MNLSPLLKLFNQISTYNTLADALHWGELTGAMRRPLGVLTAARPALLAALQADLQRPIFFMTARADRARILTEQIQIWTQNPTSVFRLPDPDALPHEKIFWGSETIQGRLAALSALVTYNQHREITQKSAGNSVSQSPSSPPLIVTSARSLMHHTLPSSEFTIMEFKVGQRIRLNEVVAQWVELGYQPEDVVEVAGSFSRRGGILDVFPPSSPNPIRIELFGDEIDSLRCFDPATQRSEHRLKSFIVGPATESLPRYASCAAEQLSHWNLADLQSSTKITFEEDIARLSRGTAFRGIEYYLPFFYNGRHGQSGESSPTSVLDYLPEDTLIFIEDPQELAAVVDELEIQARTLKRDLINVGDLPADWPDPYFGWPRLAQALITRNPLILGFTPFSSKQSPTSPTYPPDASSESPISNPSTEVTLSKAELLRTSSQSPTTASQFQTRTERLSKQPEQSRTIQNRESRPLASSESAPSTGSGQALSPTERSKIDLAPYFFGFTFVAAPAFGGQVKNVLPEIIDRKKHNERVVLVSRQSARLSHLLNEYATDSTVTPISTLNPGAPPPPSGSISLLHGMLIEGWQLRDPREDDTSLVTVMSDSELFGWKKPTTTRRPKPRKGVTPETFFADVNPGDWVVHIEHGIGCYIGLVKLDFEGVEREYLAVQYANNDKLYVPIYQADRLARYVGADDHAPMLNRLGGADWNVVKRRAKRAIEDIAKELLEIYAKRELAPGHAFSPDTEWQTEIEDAFPFVETDDQLRAVAEVKADMEKLRPMDRLVCGDVGYGKTEVALRAAFKAAMDGKQAAILAPTTVLAQQHLQTFQDRLAAYPIQIEVLSRFRTRNQQQQTLQNLAAGITDIVIGTHRLLQQDVVFKNLGLLVIDEEQRFGVKQKEKLKAMRTEVDVLTLTATPIPRTLHMSLSGARDLSTIDTPPEERLPVQTVVTQLDETLIRTAILRELDRGGQVFYVYNRIMGIEQKANRIRNIVPEAGVEVGHGQMSERQLERVMIGFVAGETDVLVSTTIIENGLDLPNVNTIIIDRADRMGLAQLYQLRGRVGRGAVQAYAYLLTPKHYESTPAARKRLEAIAEASELGAGFRIAMRDLEIRGAGDLLGARQHGHIAAVGFDLYTRLLTQAIRELKGEAPRSVTGEETAAYLNPLSEGVQLNLPIPAYVPEDYLPEEKLRFRLYRRLAGITTLEGIGEMVKELEDRFGDMPEPVANLLYQLKLKLLAIEGGVKAVVTEVGQILVRAESLEDIDRAGLERRLGPAVRVTRRQVILPLHPKQEVWQTELEKTLRLIGRMLHDPAG
jgi:transcription-repair coupling factor (superfamily II helicase)